ncbi:prepilin peptidase [Rhizobium sp. SG2393]|uniref:preprotein translocase subunit SecA n=1 Tax=Rhizobium sp. SG2393 TaxID=3276279 RepID=UPI00367136B5
MSDAFALPRQTDADAAPARARAARPYPERPLRPGKPLVDGLKRIESWTARPAMGLRRLQLLRIARETARKAARLRPDEMSDAELSAALRRLRPRLSAPERAPLGLIAEAFALLRDGARRTLGLTPRDVQLMGGYAMLRGWVAEMQTGEGKTLTALLPAAVMALSARPVHVVTVNDYLATRDAEFARPFFALFGLSSACASEEAEEDDRRAAYGAAITYCTNKQVAFDYLRDRLARGRNDETGLKIARLTGTESKPLMLRGLGFALVDEADSVLIDEARTPLILSREAPPTYAPCQVRRALDIARTLTEGRDYVVLPDRRQVVLTDEGADRVIDDPGALDETATPRDSALWSIGLVREDLVRLGLAALHLYRRDVDYVVKDDKVTIVDANTGRTMADRTWSDGLHQMVELKEGFAELSAQRITLARTTYQRFFRRYLVLSGMTGTAAEGAAELRRTYGLGIARIPTHKPPRRRITPDRILARADAKYAVIAERAAAHAARGAAVLVGTASVEASERVAAALAERGIVVPVLSARQDADEAEKIHAAGTAGRITVATNMAGRGADIPLGADVAASGGLHVIVSERHEARRVDRQLIGRSARRGEPGHAEAILSLEDDLLMRYAAPWQRRLMAAILHLPGGQRVAARLVRTCQRRAERLHLSLRNHLQKSDEVWNDALSFTGAPE